MKKRKYGTAPTDDEIARIVLLIRNNVPREIAAMSIGINRETVYLWLRKAEAGDPRYIKFMEEFDAADAEGTVKLVMDVQRAGREDWRASQWALSKKHRNRYGDRLELEHSGNISAENLSDEELKRRVQEILKRAGDVGAAEK